MSKRKNRNSSPNVPQATLERARQQLAGDNPVKPVEPVEETPVEAKAEKVATDVNLAPAPKVTPSAPRTRSSTTRRRSEPAQSKGARKERYDPEVVKNRLLNPTRVVTEEQLRQEYGFVIRDLRTIAMIAAAMIALMIVLAQFI
jgi:hypothetical protein